PFFSSLLILVLACPCPVLAQSWTRLDDFPKTARDDGAVFTINTKAYCLTGMQVGFSCTGDGAVLDATTNTWMSMSPLPSGNEREYASAFSNNGYGYVFGGLVCGGHARNDLWQYSPVTDSWQTMPPLPGAGRCACSCFMLNGNAYIVGGLDTGNQVLSEVWEYNCSGNTWLQKSNIPFGGFWRGCGFAIDTSAYVCYGIQVGGSFQRRMYRYSTTLDSWFPIPGITMPPRYYAGCAAVGQQACMYGGIDSTGVMHNELKVFDPAAGLVTTLPGLPAPALARKGCMTFSLNSRLYITTGIDSSITRIKETWQNLSPTFVEIQQAFPGFQVYPNPGTDVFTFDSEGLRVPYLLQIYDRIGKLICSLSIKEGKANLEIRQVMPSPGVYYYQARTKEGIIGQGKLVVTGN
ncbi:MAG TPA: kelch repeat-containing protein, partial [Bacteroidia bacterium]|nr:kelch repeat-containing protein [Bacteroidia bacterium]